MLKARIFGKWNTKVAIPKMGNVGRTLLSAGVDFRRGRYYLLSEELAKFKYTDNTFKERLRLGDVASGYWTLPFK